jgi:hypothetical protein
MKLRVQRLSETEYPPDCYLYTNAEAPSAGACYARLIGEYWFFCESDAALDRASELGRFAQDSSVVKRFARAALAGRATKTIANAAQIQLFA